MRIVALLLVLAIVCKGDHWKYRRLIDLLRRHEVTEAKRHEVTAAKRHEVTAAKRHEVTAAKRHEVTAAKRHEVTAAKRHEVTSAKRHKVTAASRQLTTRYAQPDETTLPTPYTKNMVENEFSGLEELFLFPGSYYLIDMIRKHCESGMGLKIDTEEIADQFQLPQCEMKNFKGILQILREIEDPQGVALLVTRTMIRPILMERMKCPATILDMGIAKMLLHQKGKFMAKEDKSLFTFFRNMAPLIDPQLEPFADDIAAAGVHELHGAIFRETIEFLWKYGLKDLAFASHGIFHHLHFFFDNVRDMDYSDRKTEFKQHLRAASSIIRCPSSAEVIEYHQREVVRFKNVFGIIETEQICLAVADFITKYVNNTFPGYVPNFENNVPLSSLCERIKLTIDDIVKGYAEYEDFLFSMRIPDLELLLGKVLSEQEWTLVEEALKRLGFVGGR